MKKLKYIFLLAGALLLASCESWLDEDPQYTINTKTQFSTVENAKQALMGCYGYMSADNAYGRAWQEVTFDIVVLDGHKQMAVLQIYWSLWTEELMKL